MDRGGDLFGRGGDGAVSVLATVLKFTIWVLLILAAAWLVREILRGAGDLVVLEPDEAREAIRKEVAK